MSSEIMDPDRQQSDPSFPLEIAAAQTLPGSGSGAGLQHLCILLRNLHGGGQYGNPSCESGLIPSWTGSEQPRHFRFDHGCLIIEAGTQKLTWERAVKHA